MFDDEAVTMEATSHQRPGRNLSCVPSGEYLGGEICAEALRLAGVRRLFGIPGVQNLGLYRALASLGDAHGLAVHLLGNEEASGFLAWGVWQQEASLSCLCLIGGPGVTHALSGIACAYFDRTPMIVLTSGVRRGSERFQIHDVDNLAILRPVCKALFRPCEVAEIGPAVASAVRAAYEGCPGPVAIEIACDLYLQNGIFEWPAHMDSHVPHQYLQRHQIRTLQPNMSCDDPLVKIIGGLMSRAAEIHAYCTVVADPGRCAVAAAETLRSNSSGHLLCPGQGNEGDKDAPHYLLQHTGCAVPAAMGTALTEAGRRSSSGGSRFVLAIVESGGFMVQGLELSFAVGLPLVVLVVQPLLETMTGAQQASMSAIAKGLGLRHCYVNAADHDSQQFDAALQSATMGHATILEVCLERCPHESTAVNADELQPDANVDALLTALRDANVRLVFTTPQTAALNCLVRDLTRHSDRSRHEIELICLTDMQSAGFAADAASRSFVGNGLTTAACLVDANDPFGLTVLSGVGEAFQDRVALLLLVLAGDQVPGDDNQFSLLEGGPLSELCKAQFALPQVTAGWRDLVTEAAMAASALPPGPVSLLIARNSFQCCRTAACCRSFSRSKTCELPTLPESLKAPASTIPALTPEVGAGNAVRVLLAARRPWIHAGLGAARGQDLVRQLSEMLEAPVSTTFSGKGVLPEDHPLWLWTSAGPAMPPALRSVADTCDVVLVLGAQLSEIASCQRQWPSKGLTVIHVDADPHILGANFTPDVAILGDAVHVLKKIVSLLEEKNFSIPRHAEDGGLHDAGLRAQLRSAHEQLRAQMRAEASLPPAGRCSPFGVYSALQLALPPDASVFVADSGNTTMMSAEMLRLCLPRHFLAPTDFSSMGYGVPAAIGAALAAKAQGLGTVIVATVGDGAFLMTGLELLTAQKHGLPLICVVMRDGELGMISGLQRARGDDEYCTMVPHGLDTLSLGDFLGVRNRRVASDAEAASAASWAYGLVARGEGPVLIEALISYIAPSFYARGAAAHEPPSCVEPESLEPLPLSRLPRRKDQQDGCTRATAERARCEASGDWDLYGCLERATGEFGSRPGTLQQVGDTTDEGRTWTYNELERYAQGLAAALLRSGVTPGKRVGVILPNVMDHILAHYAVVGPRLRCIVVNLNLRLHARELVTLLRDSSPAALIAHDELAASLIESLRKDATLRDIPIFWTGGEFDHSDMFSFNFWTSISTELASGISVQMQPCLELRGRDLAAFPCEMYYTSGSTGEPKALQLSHEMVLCHALACVSEHRFSQLDVWLHAAPMYHLVDAFAMFSLSVVGGTHVFLPGQFNPEKLLNVLETYKITSTNLATSMMALILAAPCATSLDGCFPNLRLISCGGAPLGKELMLSAQRLFGCEFFQSYGMTECCGKISLSLLGAEQREQPLAEQVKMLCSSGRPFEAINVRVVDVHSRNLTARDGQNVGEVEVRGRSVFNGYLPPLSNVGDDLIRHEHFTADGWFRTGDLATVSHAGYLQVVGRLKDMVLVGSENVYCAEVENVLCSHPAVALCCVYGVPGPEAIGEIVKAVVQLRAEMSSPTVEELQSFCSKHLADFKVPRLVSCRDKLPLTGSGKVDKMQLKALDAVEGKHPDEIVSDRLLQGEIKRQESVETTGSTASSIARLRAGGPDCAHVGSASLTSEDLVRNFRYSVSWHEAPISPALMPEDSTACWMIISSTHCSNQDAAHPVISQLSTQLQVRGIEVISVKYEVGRPLMLHVPESRRCLCIICIMPENSSVSRARDCIDEKMCRRTYDSLNMIQAIAASEVAGTSEVVVAAALNSRGSLVRQRPLSADPCIAASWSFARTASNEMDVPWRLVEVCARAGAEQAAATLINEAASALSDVTHGVPRGGVLPAVPWHSTSTVGSDDVAWSRGTRWVPRLEQLHTLPEASPYDFLQGDGSSQTCVVIGGTGSLGQQLIKLLAASEQVKDIVAVGRRSASQVTAPEENSTMCNIHAWSADISKPSDCDALIKHVKTQLHPCMHIFHLAGFLPHNGQVPAVRKLQWADCVPVLRPKVDGSVNLVVAGDSELPDGWILVCFSSIYATLGYPRLAPYAAANGFQDGLAECRVMAGHRTLAVSWSPFADAGMGHRTGPGFRAFWNSQGMAFVPLLDGMHALGCILGMSSCPPNIGIYPMAQCGRWPAPLFRHPLARRLTEETAWETKAPAATPEATATIKADDIQDLVLNTIAGLLGCAADEVPLDEAFATFGLTSMMSVDMSIRLGQALSCQLPATLAFDLVNVEHLCEYLHARLRPRPDARSLDHAPMLASGHLHADSLDALRSPAEACIDGVACILPGGGDGGSLSNWAELWQILLQGQDCVSSPPAGRPSAAARRERLTSHSAGFSQAGYLDADTLMMFDAASFGMSTAEAEIMDPQQRLCLRVARETMEDAHVRMNAAADIGVFVGVTTVDFVSLIKAKSKKMAPSAYTGTSLTTAICANRISYAFNLRGPSASCDSACSSSIVTSDLAFQALQSGRCTSAISLGVNVQVDPFWTEAFASADMLSANGRCRFGDDAADGYVRGEGCAGLLLRTRRGEDAVLPDPYATIVSLAVNQDGRSNGLTAPNPAAQQSLLQQAWQGAACTEACANYIEAHGTGTFLGDPIEITAMDRALRASKSHEIPVLRTTSLKSNIGHLECGAGAASSLKLALILRQSIIPMSLHFHTPNRNIDWSASNVTVVSEMEQLTSPGAVHRGLPCGGVSGFGFGGTNGHIVMQAHQRAFDSVPRDGLESLRAVILSDCSTSGVLESAQCMERWLSKAAASKAPRTNMFDKANAHAAVIQTDVSGIANAAAQRVAGMAVAGRARAVLVASSLPELKKNLSRLIRDLSKADTAPTLSTQPRVAVVLAGTVHQRALSVFHDLELMCSKIPLEGLRRALQKLKFEEKDLRTATFAALHAAAAMLRDDLGLRPSVIIGHGLAGEAAAFSLAGVLSCADAILLTSGKDDFAREQMWPPLVPVLSSLTCEAMSLPPSREHWQALSTAKALDGERLRLAAVAASCEIIVEICVDDPTLSLSVQQGLGESHLEERGAAAPHVVAARLGPPADGRVVGADSLAKSLVMAAASIFTLGGEVSLSKFTDSAHSARLPPRGLSPVLCWPDVCAEDAIGDDDLAVEEPSPILSGSVFQQPSSAITHPTADVPADPQADLQAEIRRLQAQVAELTAKLAVKDERIQVLEHSTICSRCGSSSKEVLPGSTQSVVIQRETGSNDEDGAQKVEDYSETKLQEIVLCAVHAIMPSISMQHLDIDTDLVEVGLDSLCAIELSHRVSSTLPKGILISGPQLLKEPTVRSMVKSVSKMVNASAPHALEIGNKMEEGKAFPASALQRGILFHQISSERPDMFLETICLEVSGPLDVAAFREAWARLLLLVPQLRARFDAFESGAATQSIMEASVCSDPDKICSIHEMWNSGVDDVHKFILQDRARGMRIDDAPLLRASLLRLQADLSHVVVTIHHLIIDGWSWGVVVEILQREYEATLAGHSTSTSKPQQIIASFSSIVQYEDSTESTSAKRYWSTMLRGAANMQPFAQTDSKVDVQRCFCSVGVAEGGAVRAFASHCGVTMAALIHAAWSLVHSSSSFCGKDDVIFGYTASRRTMPVPDIQHIVGPVVNTLPACIHATGSTDMIKFVQDVHRLLLQNADHEWLPLAVIQEVVGNRRLFDVIVDVQQDSRYSCRLGPKTTMQHKELIDCVGSPLSIRFVLKQDGSIACSAVSESSQFDLEFLDAITRGVKAVLGAMATLSAERKTVDSLRETISHEMGPSKLASAEQHELQPPELPLYAVAGPPHLLRRQGGLTDCEATRADLIGAFAAALDQWSNGASCFLIWASCCDGVGYQWVRCAVDRRARAGLNRASPLTKEVVSSNARPVAAFSYGCGLNLHRMQVGRRVNRLFCFNAAGSSAAQFAALGQDLQSNTLLELVTIELPGHGARRHEEALTTMEDIVNLVISEHGDSIATAYTTGGYTLLGVSFGALVAFEVACRMTQQGLSPTQLLLASQASPSCADFELDLNMEDADLVCALEERGWLNSEFVQSQADVWQTILPAMRADLAAEKSYLQKRQLNSSKRTPLSCQVSIFAGSEDTSLLKDADRTWNPWGGITNGAFTQCIVPGVGHGFVDMASGRKAVSKVLVGDRPGFSSVAVHLCVERDQWALVGDDGLVPEIVLNGLADSFAKVMAELHAGGLRSLSEVLPGTWRAQPMSEPTSLPTQLLQDAFVDWEAEASEEAAIIDVSAVGSERKLTYACVESRSSIVALKLMSVGVQCQDRVALVSGKGWPQLVGAIGILRSGAAYLPIDPRQIPRERAEMLLKLASVSAVVTDKSSLSEFEWLENLELPVVVSGCLDGKPEKVPVFLSEVRSRCKPDESAYILYTSGSTGVPKGVNCHHQGAINTCLDLNRRFSISAEDRVLALSSFSFDLSVYDLFGTAMAGGTVVVPHPEAITPPDPGAWLETVQKEGITLINAVPAFLELLVGYCETTGSKLPKSLRLVWMSGDWVPLSLPHRIRSLAEGPVTVVALGGATEAAIWSNMYVVPEQLPSGWKSIPYGRPLGNQTMYVLDERSELLEHTAPWVAGMIYIGGAGVALGYLGDDVKTAASFILHPVSGERIYRTGDLGRLRPGESQELLIEILGREDSQVKLNGFRIELGEVEATVSALDTVEESCASVIHAGGGPFLAAFFRGPAVDIGELQQHLAQRLPSQLVPKVLLRLDDRFPLNSNGKVDRKRLAEMHADELANLASASKGIVAAVGESELRIAEALAEILSISSQDVCVETNLFSVGLNSLGSMRLVAAALSRGLHLSVRDVFAHPTVRALARISASQFSDASLRNVVPAATFQIGDAADESCAPFPLIGITKAYWTGLWSNPYCPAGCKPQIAFEFDWEAGRIDVERLERCFDEFIQRNAAFRAVVLQDSPAMRFLEAHEVTPIKFKVHQVQNEEDVEEQCDQAYRDIFDNAIDPFTFPLLQGCVVHMPNGRGSRFYYCVSLFVMDGITDLTWRLHISKLYRGETLPAPPSLTYKAYNEGYVDDTAGIHKAAKWQGARDFWIRKINAGLPLPPQLPMVKECSSNRGSFSDRGTTTVSARHFENIKAAAARFGVTPTAILLMLYCVCLGRHAASSQMLINVLHCLRHPVHSDHNRVLGNFSSSFLCPIDISLSDSTGPRSLLQLARAVMDALVECQTYNTISGVDVMSLINSKQAALGKAAAPYVFVSALGLEDSLRDWQSLCFREVRVIESTSGTYMVHGIKEYPDGSMLSGFNVVDGAFEPQTIEALVGDHRCLLEAIAVSAGDGMWHRCPNEILGDLPVPESLGSALAGIPGELLHGRLSDHAARVPSHIAIVDAETGFQLSYRGYLDAAMAVRLCLITCGASNGFARCGAPLVAVICEKSWQQIVAVLGVLLAECAYLPINVAAWPRNRIEAVLEAGDVVALVTSDRTLAHLPWLTALQQPLVDVDQAVTSNDKAAAWEAASSDDPDLRRQGSEDQLAYCIFTSGSTGQPKGVAMSHKAALNTLRALADLHQLGSGTVVLGLSQLSFDLSVSDIFLTLRIGGTLVVPPDSSLSPPSPAQWRGMCAEHGVTLWNSVPALFGLLCEEANHTGHMLPRSLRRIWLSGDVIPEKLPASARAVAPEKLQIFAMGGATEAGIWSNSADISNHHPRDGAVPYGNALPGQGMKVVRLEDLRTAAVGVSGMLVISGASLMMGYYNDEHTTSKALVQVHGEQLYLTQDAGYTRRCSDGSLECMITGRIYGEDGGFVKVRGFRVELHELEAMLRSHSAIKASVVAMHQGELAAYVVLNPESVGPSEDGPSQIDMNASWEALKQDLRNAMAASLPIYALPRWIHVIDALPLSSNGKLDRAALPIPIDSREHDMADNEEVQNEVEAGVLAAAQELGIPVKSRSDNIFSAGADSVAGLRLIFKLEAAHKVKINVGQLFGDGRISSIATDIGRGTSSAEAPVQDAVLNLATLRSPSIHKPTGKRLPLFLCHGAGTTALALSALASELEKGSAFGEIYGISDSFLTSSSDRFKFGSIEEVATSMADLVLRAWPRENDTPLGEVALGGWSYGGVVAFACARILEARGLPVRLVLMLDAPIGQKDGCRLDDKAQAELAASASGKVAERIAAHFEACNTLLSQFVPACGEAVKAHVLEIRPFTSQVDFLLDSDRIMLAQSWCRVFIDGADHFTLVRPPFAEDVAKHVLSKVVLE